MLNQGTELSRANCIESQRELDDINILQGLINTYCVVKSSDTQLIVSPRGFPQEWLIDLRRILVRRDALGIVGHVFWKRFGSRGSFQIAGLETAGIPLLLAIILSSPVERRDVNGLIIRKVRKNSGLGQIIEGTTSRDPVVLVDDNFNSAESAEKARVVVEQEGLRVTDLFVITNYESDMGKRWSTNNCISVSALFTPADFGLNVSRRPSALLRSYRLLWRRVIVGANAFHVVPKSAPLLIAGLLYRGCDLGKMQAFDATTGDIVWEYQCEGTFRPKGIWSSPCESEGRLYFGAYNGVFYCLDATTGLEIWQKSLCEWIGASPIVVQRHGLVYVGLEYERPWARGAIAALDAVTGEFAWQHFTEKLQHGSPGYWAAGDLIIWGTADYEMLGIEAKSGKVAWSFKTRRSVKYAPAIDEERGVAAFISFDRSIYLLDLASGSKLGEWETGEIGYTTPLIAEGKIFCGSGDGHLYVIDLETKEIVRKLKMGARVYSSPRRIDDSVFFGTNGGKLIELDVHTLEIVGQIQLPDAVTNAVAATSDGRRIFVSTYMNHLFAFER